MSRWTNWYDIQQARSSHGPLADRYGLYRIRIVIASKGRQPRRVPIRRLVGVDSDGVIYIGRSGVRRNGQRDIANRVNEFLHQQHSAGVRYNRHVKRKLRRRGYELQVSGRSVADDSLKASEASALRKYLKIHAELPPLNNNQPGEND